MQSNDPDQRVVITATAAYVMTFTETGAISVTERRVRAGHSAKQAAEMGGLSEHEAVWLASKVDKVLASTAPHRMDHLTT